MKTAESKPGFLDKFWEDKLNMCIRGPVLGRKCIDLIIKSNNSERLGQRGEFPASLIFSCTVRAFGIMGAQRAPWSRKPKRYSVTQRLPDYPAQLFKTLASFIIAFNIMFSTTPALDSVACLFHGAF